MKKTIICFSLFLLTGISLFAQVSINNNGSGPDASAILDVNSTTMGLLPPRMTTTQRKAILSPAEGLVVYNTDEKALNIYTGMSWKAMTQSHAFACGLTITVNHLVSGGVAPVNKTVAYGTVNGIPGEPAKCWITKNLGADHQATAVSDATEPSAGWYWQFNHKQAYKNDGTIRTPNSAWINSISEATDWIAANDPCSMELGATWRIPTSSEWNNIYSIGSWTTWADPWGSGLKLHAAGYLMSSNGSLSNRGMEGYYWSSSQSYFDSGDYLYLSSGFTILYNGPKASGLSLRCVRDN